MVPVVMGDLRQDLEPYSGRKQTADGCSMGNHSSCGRHEREHTDTPPLRGKKVSGVLAVRYCLRALRGAGRGGGSGTDEGACGSAGGDRCAGDGGDGAADGAAQGRASKDHGKNKHDGTSYH